MTTGSGELLAGFQRALLALDRLRLAELLGPVHDDGTRRRLTEALVVPALEWIGTEWEEGRVALSQVYMSGRLCEELVDQVLPAESPVRRRQPKMAIAVLEDYHLLGKRMVYSSLRASGFELADYGRVEAEALACRAAEERIEVLLISTLMLASALQVHTVRAKLGALGHSARIVVGGAPFRLDTQLWQEVGADAMGATAGDAAQLVLRWAEGAS